MSRIVLLLSALLALGTPLAFAPSLLAAEAPAATTLPTPTTPSGAAILLTVFLRHDQTKTLDEINDRLNKNGFWQAFPPPGTEVVSWYVMMGIGQVVTLKVPPDQLRAVNVALEKRAWGAFRTEFYPTYDFVPVWREMTGRP